MFNFIQLKKNIQLYKDEQVYCIPSTSADHLTQGYNNFAGKKQDNIFEESGKYIQRAKVEGLPGAMQLIPYLVVMNKDSKILTHIHKKTKKISLGFSSHITPDIGRNKNVAHNACVCLATYNIGEFLLSSKLLLDGFIKTSTKETDGHLGLVYVAYVNDINIKDDENYKYEFLSKEEIFNKYGSLEEWAKLTLGRFY